MQREGIRCAKAADSDHDVHWMAMDRVRFGRALGYGARHAAKTLMQAADAASAPNPAPRTAPPAAAPTVQRPVALAAKAGVPRPRAATAQRTVAAARQQAKGSFVAPIAKFSGTLWLQVTGVFFGLVALAMGGGAWRARAAFHAPPGSHAAIKLYTYLAVFVVFAYFAISSFVRAERR